MAFKEGGMSAAQIKKYFGDSVEMNGSGSMTFKNDGDIDKFMGDKKVRKFFINELGRDASDWDDGEKSANDLGTAVRALHNGDGEATEKKPETNQWSQPMAEARAGVTAYENTILPNAGDYITGKKKDMQGDYLKDYKLNLAKELKPTNADGSARDSTIQDKKEEDAVAG